MKKVLLSGLVFGALLFGACNKEETPIAGDEVFDANLKGYAKLPQQDQTFGDEVAFSWNAITASDFAHGKTPPFNNWEKPLVDGVYVYRVPEKEADKGFYNVVMDGGGAALQKMYTDKKQQFGNGNDPVWIWFDPAQLAEINVDCPEASLTVLVRYRSSNNVAFKFNLLAAAEWCSVHGPISLDFNWTVYSDVYGTPGSIDLGEITQVRIQDPEYCGDNNKWDFCLVYADLDPMCLPYIGCTTISLTDFEGFIEAIEAELADNQRIEGFVFAGTDIPFEFGETKVCEDTQIEPIIITTRCITVVVNGVETTECFDGGDYCSHAYVDLGAFSKDECIIVGWNGDPELVGTIFEDCITEDMVFVADLKCLGKGWDSVTATNDADEPTIVKNSNHFCYAVLSEDGTYTLDLVWGNKIEKKGTATVVRENGTITITINEGISNNWGAVASAVPFAPSNGNVHSGDFKHNLSDPGVIKCDAEGVVYLYLHLDPVRFYE